MSWLQDDAERKFYDSIVHGLRSQGWDRLEAETEAEGRVIRRRERLAQEKK